MKKGYLVDLGFIAALLTAILIVPAALDAVYLAVGLYGLNYPAYLFICLPFICYGITLLHEAVTGRFSVLYLGSMVLLLFAGGVYTHYCLRPQDPISAHISSGLSIGMLLMFVAMISALIEALGVPVVDRIRRNKAAKQGQALPINDSCRIFASKKIDLLFVAVQLLVIVGVPFIMTARGASAQDIQYYLNGSILRWLCCGITLVHVIATRRFSVLLLGSQIVFLFAGSIYHQHCLGPQDPVLQQFLFGIGYGVLNLFVCVISTFVELVGALILNQIRRFRERRLA